MSGPPAGPLPTAAGSPQLRDALLIAALVVVSLLPFIGKAFHIDDPVVLLVANQILSDPLDFYGLTVNWSGFTTPVWLANNNPPLLSFYVAALAAVGGWGERALHVGMMAPAVVLAVGTYLLSRRLSASPRTAALAAWTMPVVLVSSTTVMSDAMLLAGWVVAVWLWVEGLERGSWSFLAVGGVAVGMCVLTKYSGIALVPLLLAYSLARQRSLGAWFLALLIPVAMLAAFDVYMQARYGHSPLSFIGPTALGWRNHVAGVGALSKVAVGLSFSGGCFLTALMFAPLIWTRRALLAWAGLLALAISIVPMFGELARMPLRGGGGVHLLPVAQIGLFCVIGIQVFFLVVTDLWRSRDAESLLLALWIAGVFVFATFLNWSANARSLMPAAPAVAILLVRRLDSRRHPGAADASLKPILALVPALVVALSVSWADLRLANSARTAATTLAKRYGQPGRTLWFQGAWGFQLYMERAGGRKLDFKESTLMPGDLLIVPFGNTNVLVFPFDIAAPVKHESFPAADWIATMEYPPLGAGFYSDVWGPLPFAIGDVPPQVYYVSEVRRRFRLAADALRPARRNTDPFPPPSRGED